MDERAREDNEAARSASGSGATYKPAVIILIVLVLMLSVGLWVRHNNAVQLQSEHEAKILYLSNQVLQVTADLGEAKQVITVNESSISQQVETLKKLSNTVTQTSASLAKTEADAKAAAAAAAKAMAERDQRITDLEGQRDDLTKRMTELNGAITGLEGQIEETQRKLAASEGDRSFLLKELRRLQQEKMDLEKQFSDLAMLRDQVRKLKDELSISKRLDWLRRGIYGTPKGAEKLQRPMSGSTNKNFDLNVELKQDGTVKINPPATNAPPR